MMEFNFNIFKVLFVEFVELSALLDFDNFYLLIRERYRQLYSNHNFIEF